MSLGLNAIIDPALSLKELVMSKSNNSKKAEEKVKRFSIDLPLSLHRRLKMASVREDKTMGDIIKELLDKNLKE